MAKRFSFQWKITLYVSAIIVMICTVFFLLFEHHLRTKMHAQIGDQALQAAQLIAEMPSVHVAFTQPNPTTSLQPIADKAQRITNAAFIVIGNEKGIRYTHPDPEKIGQQMVGGDNDHVLLDGKTSVTTVKGSLGESIRGKAPIIENGQIIGVVSVGFLTTSIEKTTATLFLQWLGITSIVALIGIICALLFSIYMKKQLHGMEPAEIATLYQLNENILATTSDAIVTTSTDGLITFANPNATAFFQSHPSLVGLPIQQLFHDNIVEQPSFSTLELVIANETILLSKAPIYTNKQLSGAMYTFRKKIDYEHILQELHHVKQQAQLQRAQTHEFSNKLHLIRGLLAQQKVQEAMQFIDQHASEQQQLYNLSNQPSYTILSALLTGKRLEAKEREIDLIVTIPDDLMPLNDAQLNALTLALGNVIQNAFDAVQQSTHTMKQVHVTLEQYEHELLITVEDSGNGIPQNIETQLFERHFSTKKGFDRGHGLALSQQALTAVNGEIWIDDGDLSGACFLITLRRIHA